MRVILKTKIRFALLALSVAGGFLPASKSYPQSVTFDSVLNRGLSQSPLVKQIDGEFAAQIAESLQTRILSNPQIGIAVGNAASAPKDSDGTQISLILSQPLKISNFGSRQVLSTLMDRAADIDQKVALLAFTQRILFSYGKLWALQTERNILNTAQLRAKKIGDRLKKTVSQGATNMGEGALFESNSKKLSGQLLGITADTEREKAELLKLTSVSVDDLKLENPSFEILLTEDALVEQAQEGILPIQERLALREQLAAERLNVAKKDAYPTFAPQVGFQRTEDGGNFVQLGIQFDLPLFERNQPEKIKREAEARVAQAEKDYGSGTAYQNEIRAYYRSFIALKKQSENLEREVIPLLENALSSFNRQYTAGGGSLLTTWQAQRELLDTARSSVELKVRLLTLKSELSVLVGQQL